MTWILTMRVEGDDNGEQAIHFQFSVAGEVAEDYTPLCAVDKEPKTKSWTVALLEPRPPCPLDWSMIPYGWRYAAMDADGTWYLYRKKPERDGSVWSTGSSTGATQISLDTPHIQFHKSLYERPND